MPVYKAIVLRFLLTITSIFFALEAYAEPSIIGKVIFAEGQFQASSSQTRRTLRRGADILQGDTLQTAANSQAQIRFTDGALLTLQASTEFAVNAYQSEGNKKEFQAKLLKGAFRAVSGTIAKEKPQDYQIATSVATIGVRGTDYSAALDAKSKLLVGVFQGKVSIKNDAGEIIIGDDSPYKYARITSADELPQGLITFPAGLITNATFRIEAQQKANGTAASQISDKGICIQ